MVRLITINNDVRHTRLRGSQGNGIGGANGQGGTEGNYEVASGRSRKGPLEISFTQVLAKANGGGFQKTTAVAEGRLAGLLE